MTDLEIQEVRTGVQQCLDDYVDAALSLDVGKCLACFASTEEPVSAMDGKLLVGWTAHVDYYHESMKPLTRGNDFQFKAVHIYPLAADAAVCTTESEWSFDVDSGETIRSGGSWVYALKRIGGAWRIVHSGGTHVAM